MVSPLIARPTRYAGHQFRSRLEARWAACFDRAKLRWEYEPFDLVDWTPDFRLTFPCYVCDTHHRVLIEVKPYEEWDLFSTHVARQYLTRVETGQDRNIPADGIGLHGLQPEMVKWGIWCGTQYAWWFPTWWTKPHWAEAGNLTQWAGPATPRRRPVVADPNQLLLDLTWPERPSER